MNPGEDPADGTRKMRAPRIWIDVTSLDPVLYGGSKRPTGIPRVVTEIVAAALRDPDRIHEIGLVRYDLGGRKFTRVMQAEFQSGAISNWQSPTASPSLVDRLRATRLGKALRGLRLQRRLTRARTAANRVASNLLRSLGQRQDEYLHPFENGDVFFGPGIWCQEGVLPALHALRRNGLALKCGFLVHDCIPLLRPEFFPAHERKKWAANLGLLTHCADFALANSHSTARDMERAFPGLSVAPQVIRFGDPDTSTARTEDADAGVIPDRPFVLIVGTVEVRKNHILSLRAWRSMAERVADLPLLVFAGNWGWKVEDLKEELADSNWLDGHIRMIASPSDGLLSELYRRCLFTLYPSHYEGWGLPIRESLAHGKLCIAANNSSMPEAGGDLAAFFESNCQPDLERKIEDYLDADRRKQAEQRIGQGYQNARWEDCWSEIRTLILQNPLKKG